MPPSGPDRAPLRDRPLAWMVAVLLLAELVARLTAPAPLPDDSWRNPANLRRWPEYTLAGPDDAEPLVVLVGNSQAVGRELVPPQVGYPALLDRQLAAIRPGARLLNWSVQGLRASELELLSLAAVERGADLLVLAVGYKTFEHPHLVHLGYGSSDVDLLAGRPTLWRTLRDQTVTGRLTTWDQLLERGLQLGTALGRSRRPVLDALLGSLEPVQRRALSGHAVPDLRPLGVDADGAPLRPLDPSRREPLRRAARVAAARELAGLDAAALAPPLAVCQDVIAGLARRAAAADLALLWVWVPMDGAGLPPATRPLIEGFQRRADQTLREVAIPRLDLLDAVPSDEFLSVTHLDEAGHRRLARVLLPALGDALP